MVFQVEITADAEQDAADILDWLLVQNAGESGLRWFLKMDKEIASLAKLPSRCRLAPENLYFSFKVRQLLYGQKQHRYCILFTIEHDTVYVLHMRHGRRLPVTQTYVQL